MVRAFSAMPNVITRWFNRSGGCGPVRELGRHVIVPVLVIIAGCAVVPRSRMDECQKLTQSLRADNGRLKDRVLALQVQNRDYAERAVDDARRLAVQDEAIERLEHSVQAYQDDRTRLEAAYKQLVSNLGDCRKATARSHVATGVCASRLARQLPDAFRDPPATRTRAIPAD